MKFTVTGVNNVGSGRHHHRRLTANTNRSRMQCPSPPIPREPVDAVSESLTRVQTYTHIDNLDPLKDSLTCGFPPKTSPSAGLLNTTERDSLLYLLRSTGRAASLQKNLYASLWSRFRPGPASFPAPASLMRNVLWCSSNFHARGRRLTQLSSKQ